MRASHHSQAAQPLPLPPPPLSLPSPPAAPRRGRHRTSSASSSSSSLSSVSTASSLFCPSPSPAPSPRASTTSVVPFSWERHPGVPKSSFRGGRVSSNAETPLPLPPPLRVPARRRRRRRANVNVPASSSVNGAINEDPFVAAFAECTRDVDDDDVTEHDVAEYKMWTSPTTHPTVSGGAEHRWWLAGGGLVGFLDLYGCKNVMAVADIAFVARRPVVPRAGLGRASRR